MLSITSIHPIILPQELYTDRFQHRNSYIEMNPTMSIDSDGKVSILVRCINYRKFHNKEFILYEPYANSKYYILRGTIDAQSPLNLNSFTVEQLTEHNTLPRYPTYWLGMEDIRMIDSQSILVTIPECNMGGNPSIFRAKLDENHVHSFQECYPNQTEKNWMPFTDKDGYSRVIYSLNPFIIKEIESDTMTIYELSARMSSQLHNYHGSTNGIPYQDNKFLFLIHINKERTYHRWLIMGQHYIGVSDEFVIFRHSYIEFPVSLCCVGERLFISMGVNDDKAFIIETNIKNITMFPFLIEQLQ